MRLTHIAPASLFMALALTGVARASSGLDSPDNGVEVVGRGSAWIARADTPLAAFYNPAGLVDQATGVHVGTHLMLQKRCFARVDETGQPVSPGGDATLFPGPGAPNGPKTPVCTDSSAFPNPQLAATFRVNRDFAIGLAVVGPHAAGKITFPETVPYTNKFGASVAQPSPNRYLMTSADSLLVFPTISAGYRVNDQLSVGAGFIWGIASVAFTSFAETVSPPPNPGKSVGDDFASHQDMQAKLKAKDLFIPGVVLGALWHASPEVDVAGSFKWQDAIRTSSDLTIQGQYFAADGKKNANLDPAFYTDKPGAGTVHMAIPMEAKIGGRYHARRAEPVNRPVWAGDSTSAKPVRDPLSEDVFDVEMNVTWAKNSAVDVLELRFQEGIAVKGTPSFVPVNGDIPHQWKDVFGVRLGGEYVALPGRLAVRAGGYFETKGQDAAYLNPDFQVSQKIGIAGGATVRLGSVDVSAAYQHTIFGDLDNGGQGAIHALSGDATTGNYRSLQVVNGGKLTTSLDEVALGGTIHF